jgi:ankyrin repeat protein
MVYQFLYTSLHEACIKGHIEIVKELLKAGANFDAQGVHRNTPLHYACWKKRKKVVEVLLREGADPNIRGNCGNSPLYYACLTRDVDVEIVKALLNAGADPNAQSIDEDMPLHIACFEGHVAIVKELLEHPKIDVNALGSCGNRPLHCACSTGNFNIEIVQALLNAGADAYINAKNQYGYTPLYYAYRNGHFDIVKVLLEAGADSTEKCYKKICALLEEHMKKEEEVEGENEE